MAAKWGPQHISLRRTLIAAALCALVFGALSATSGGDFIERQTAQRLDFLLRGLAHRDPELSPRMKTFVYDDAAMSHLEAAAPSLAQWADMVEALAERKPAIVLIPKLFDVPPPADEALAFVERLRRVNVRVAVAAFTAPREIAARAQLPVEFGALPALQLLAVTKDPAMARFVYGAPESVRSAFAAFGHVSYFGDGLVDPVLAYRGEAGAIPHLALLASEQIGVADGALTSYGKVVPVDGKGRLRIDVIDPLAYPARTYGMKALLVKAAKREPISVVEPGDTVLLLPAMYTGNGDWVKTPYGESPGGYVFMSLVSSVLSSRWITPVGGSSGATVAVVVAFALGGALTAALIPYGLFWVVILAVLALAPIVGASALAFLGVQLAWLFPVAAFGTAASAAFGLRARAFERERLRIGHELAMAIVVQEAFFPDGKLASAHEFGPIKIAGVTKPMTECSGDWWGCEVVQGQGIALFMCDAMGHGVSAALLMATTIAAIRAECRAPAGDGPAALLQRCNEVVYTITRGKAAICTMCILAEAGGRKLRIANAGQHPPVVLTADKTTKPVRINGNPLGIFAGEKFKEVSIELAPGERLFAFSDGLVEAANAKGEMFSRHGVLNSMKTATGETTSGVFDHMLASWTAHLDGTPAQDDMTLTVIELAA